MILLLVCVIECLFTLDLWCSFLKEEWEGTQIYLCEGLQNCNFCSFV